MTIEFENPKPVEQARFLLQTVADNMMRPVSREMDENEHAIPFGYVEFMNTAMKAMGSGSAGSLAPSEGKNSDDPTRAKRPSIAYQLLANQLEMLAWGDVGMYLITPGGGLGAAAVQAAGSPEQRKTVGGGPSMTTDSTAPPGALPSP